MSTALASLRFQRVINAALGGEAYPLPGDKYPVPGDPYPLPGPEPGTCPPGQVYHQYDSGQGGCVPAAGADCPYVGQVHVFSPSTGRYRCECPSGTWLSGGRCTSPDHSSPSTSSATSSALPVIAILGAVAYWLLRP